ARGAARRVRDDDLPAVRHRHLGGGRRDLGRGAGVGPVLLDGLLLLPGHAGEQGGQRDQPAPHFSSPPMPLPAGWAAVPSSVETSPSGYSTSVANCSFASLSTGYSLGRKRLSDSSVFLVHSLEMRFLRASASVAAYASTALSSSAAVCWASWSWYSTTASSPSRFTSGGTGVSMIVWPNRSSA